MRLATYSHPKHGDEPTVGVVQGDRVLNAAGLLGEEAPLNMRSLLTRGPDAIRELKDAAERFAAEHQATLTVPERVAVPLWEVDLLAPIQRPPAIRDFYAFEQHVATAHAKRGRPVPPAWYDIPVFYFGNPAAVYGPDAAVPKPAATSELDFELELACVIGTAGRNIAAADAWDHIAGYTIMNDWSARDLQRHEMSVGLGPAKGKDFATSLGPYLVTPDEIARSFHDGRHNLTMIARINGEDVTRGNADSIYWTFGQMIERASQDADLTPGDVIGSGTIGGGCLLELGAEVHPWLEPGDEVELEIECLGRLRNRVV
jgi:fumarylacetoacetate (FAA) hydrolase